MNQGNPQGRRPTSDPELARSYLGEIAQTYAESLDAVAKAPFINQVNMCMRVLSEDREQMAAEIVKVKEEMQEYLSRPAEDTPDREPM